MMLWSPGKVLVSFQNSPFFQTYDINLNEGILGDGTFSVCRKCQNKQTGKEYAVKIVSRRIDCTREIQLLRLCQGHPNIVRLHEVFHDEVSQRNVFFFFLTLRRFYSAFGCICLDTH